MLLMITMQYLDIFFEVGKLLKDKGKMYLTMTSKLMDTLKYKFVYHRQMDIERIKGLSYIDNFECIRIANARDIRPKSAKCVYFDSRIAKVPSFVTHLTFTYGFDQQINGHIPSSVTHLTFGFNFNQPINGCIPLSVSHLTFGCNFNQAINGCIPSSVTHLTFGKKFNRPINGCIPSSVTHLTFGECFYQRIKNNIPSSVTHLTTKGRFYEEIGHKILSVTHYEYGGNDGNVELLKILPCVTHFIYNCRLEYSFTTILPQTITHLTFKNNCGLIAHIPQSVTHLTFGDGFNNSIAGIIIPNSVTHLNFGRCFKQSIRGNIPLSVTDLTFGEYSNQVCDRHPSSITHLTLSNLNMSITTNPYFAKVTHLTFSSEFNLSIKNYIPSFVKYLKFGPKFDESLDTVPLSVTQIEISEDYVTKIREELMPKIIRY
jgi:hypothetical protein